MLTFNAAKPFFATYLYISAYLTIKHLQIERNYLNVCSCHCHAESC